MTCHVKYQRNAPRKTVNQIHREKPLLVRPKNTDEKEKENIGKQKINRLSKKIID